MDQVWDSKKEKAWLPALDKYWDYIKPENLSLERELLSLDIALIENLNEKEWYEFLRNKIFKAKYTAPNRYATTTKQLDKYLHTGKLDELHLIKRRLFSFNREDILEGLMIACEIKGFGPAGASALLATLFPRHFGNVDQFLAKALLAMPQYSSLLSGINPLGLTISDSVKLIKIMRDKANENNQQFKTDFWTPRKIDMVLWASRM